MNQVLPHVTQVENGPSNYPKREEGIERYACYEVSLRFTPPAPSLADRIPTYSYPDPNMEAHMNSAQLYCAESVIVPRGKLTKQQCRICCKI